MISDPDVFEMMRGMAVSVPIVAGGILCTADSAEAEPELFNGMPMYISLADEMVERAKWWWAFMLDSQPAELPVGTCVIFRSVAGVKYGRVIRSGYDLYANQYRVKFFDGTDQWADKCQCRAVLMANG